MSFLSELEARKSDAIIRAIAASGAADVERALCAESLGELDLLALLSPAAAGMIERIAFRARDVTLRHFGRTVELFTPLYLSNYCVNGCVYCGFNARNGIPRGRLSYEEAEREGACISVTGLRHVLLLTGESPAESPVGYIAECVGRLRGRFDSVSVEVYPLDAEGYERLVAAGCDGVTLFQETYDKTLYADVHPSGPKRDFRWRLDAPERACAAGMRTVSVGALLGLGPWRSEVFFTGLHAAWLRRNYPDVSIGISLPRMRPHAGCYDPSCPVSDREFVQILLALRLFLPSVSITVSTRENAYMRDNLVGLGMTRMSAGVSTGIGGRSAEEKGSEQFDISDSRNVDEVCAMLESKGYQPVLKDWMRL